MLHPDHCFWRSASTCQMIFSGTALKIWFSHNSGFASKVALKKGSIPTIQRCSYGSYVFSIVSHQNLIPGLANQILPFSSQQECETTRKRLLNGKQKSIFFFLVKCLRGLWIKVSTKQAWIIQGGSQLHEDRENTWDNYYSLKLKLTVEEFRYIRRYRSINHVTNLKMKT